MSIRASEYAREALEADSGLGTAPRLVLMLLAERCNGRTGTTYSGDWLARAARLNPRNVQRSIAQLIDAGIVAADHRRGRASIVRFPLDAYLSTTPASAPGCASANPGGAIPNPGGAIPNPGRQRRRTKEIPGYTPPPTHPRECVCDGTGWEHVDDGERGYVRPCNARKEAL